MSDKNNTINIHLLTDSTGETLQNISNVVMTQLPSYKARVFLWPFTTNVNQMKLALESIKITRGVVMYTILSPDLIEYMEKELQGQSGISIVSALDSIMNQIGHHLKIESPQRFKRNQISDLEYERKIKAMEYMWDYDDGKLGADIETAEIVIYGVSRSGKTPISAYLAYRGYMIANVPFISNAPTYGISKINPHALLIGLSIDPIRLLELRKNRLQQGGNSPQYILAQNYIDFIEIEKELNLAKKFYNSIKCHIIDVTSRSIEEISAHIIRLYNLKIPNPK